MASDLVDRCLGTEIQNDVVFKNVPTMVAAT